MENPILQIRGNNVTRGNACLRKRYCKRYFNFLMEYFYTRILPEISKNIFWIFENIYFQEISRHKYWSIYQRIIFFISKQYSWNTLVLGIISLGIFLPHISTRKTCIALIFSAKTWQTFSWTTYESLQLYSCRARIRAICLADCEWYA